MIYGLNFNGTNIPDHVRRRFAQRKSLMKGSKLLHLQGVCNSLEEVAHMKIQAQNGYRLLLSVGPRKLGTENWYGLYVL